MPIATHTIEDPQQEPAPTTPHDLLPQAPRSMKTVAGALRAYGPMTGAALRDTTGLPRRTIFSALVMLREIGLLRERDSLRDTRQKYYWLDATPATVASRT